jgi:EAL domain-containing protein (putative c-di-GMP-specific phosphodiesterase class I)
MMVTLRPGADPASEDASGAGQNLPTSVPLLGAQSLLARPRLEFFLPWLFRLTFAFGLAEEIAGASLNEPAFVGAGILTTGFGLIVVVARRLIARGRALEATWMVAVSLGIAGFCGTLLVPDVAEAMALLPILGFALLLPYALGRRRLPIVALVVGSTTLILFGAAFGHPAPLTGGEGPLFTDAVLVTIVGLVLAALVDFWNNAVRSLEALETSVSRQNALSDERIALGRVLESLKAKATVDATADAIAAALVTLPGITIGGILEFHEGGLRVLAISAPAAFPLHAGDRVSEPQAQRLLASSTRGPWAEPARQAAAPGFEVGAGDRIGLLATVYAPMRSGDNLIGLIGLGTSDPALARHLIDDLPAAGEVAATATALIGPGLLARRAAADARSLIETIIADRAFMPVFQAIATLPDREVVAYEALTRFTDGVRPDRHFANAIAVGLGVELELVTLETAVRAAERIPYDLALSLNVSPAAIEAGSRLSRILRLSHHPLILELTEHVAVADYGRLRTALKVLRVPFRIAVDDAGAGYASMTHVVELGPSLVKLDISLVRGIDGDPVRQALIAGMLFFSEKTNCRLLAEGIETEAEMATLAAIGVPLGQGYLLGRPGEFIGRQAAVA